MLAVLAVLSLSCGTEEPAQVDPRPTTTSTTEPEEEVVERPPGWPPVSDEVSDEPLGAPGAVPEGGGPHEFVALQADGTTPVGFDPCRPIHFVTREGGPPNASQLIAEAMAVVTAATGLQFADDGTTDEVPSNTRRAYQPERYGERWAPVLIAWGSTSSPSLGMHAPRGALVDLPGWATSQSVELRTTNTVTGESERSGFVYVTGTVTLDTRYFLDVLEQPEGHARARAVVAHELAHVVGLGHVDDPGQLMNPITQIDRTDFAPGDLEGLARLGQLDCFPQI